MFGVGRNVVWHTNSAIRVTGDFECGGTNNQFVVVVARNENCARSDGAIMITPSFQLTAPTGHYATVALANDGSSEYQWSVHAADGAILKVGDTDTRLACQVRARRALEFAAYGLAVVPAEMKDAKWRAVDAEPHDESEWDAARLRARFLTVMAQQVTDMAIGEIEKNYAPIALADGRFGVRTMGFEGGRVRPVNYQTLTLSEFAALVETMERGEVVEGVAIV